MRLAFLLTRSRARADCMASLRSVRNFSASPANEISYKSEFTCLSQRSYLAKEVAKKLLTFEGHQSESGFLVSNRSILMERRLGERSARPWQPLSSRSKPTARRCLAAGFWICWPQPMTGLLLPPSWTAPWLARSLTHATAVLGIRSLSRKTSKN
ncbi:hypothetical protein Q3G72_020644 [Acer saccharum]|nr:hypothetical protein Q3G72_020644 [Acer saccharum]